MHSKLPWLTMSEGKYNEAITTRHSTTIGLNITNTKIKFFTPKMARQASKQAGRQANRQADKQRGRQTGRQANRQAGKQGGRQTSRQINR